MLELIQYISQCNRDLSHLEGIEKACSSGVKWIQLRFKEHTFEELIEVGREARKICDKYAAKLIINDNVAAVLELQACGVHLGKQDMPIREARKILGKDRVIGATANTFEDIVDHVKNGADYIGLGPFRFTQTKQNLSPVLGLTGYVDILDRCREAGLKIPIYAIGGIELEDVAQLMRTGISGIAVSGMLANCLEPKKLIEELNLILNQTKMQYHVENCG